MSIDLPRVSPTKIWGLLEILSSLGGKCEIARLSSQEDLDLDELLPIIDAAKILKLVTTTNGDVTLTEDGPLFLKAKIRERKRLFRERIKGLEPFLIINQALKERRELKKGELLEMLKPRLENLHDLDGFMDAVIKWGRYAQIFHYKIDSEIFYV